MSLVPLDELRCTTRINGARSVMTISTRRQEIWSAKQWGSGKRIIIQITTQRYWNSFFLNFTIILIIMLLFFLPTSYVVQLAPGAWYRRVTGPIWLDDLRCSASNIGLAGCTFKPWGYNNCGHGEDMGLVCGSAWRSEDTVIRRPKQCRRNHAAYD